MNKRDLINALRDDAEITREKAEGVVKIFFDSIGNALAEKKRVEIRGVFSFSVKHYKGFRGRNPRTGEKIAVEGKKLPVFRCGRELNQRLNYGRNKRPTDCS